MVTYFLMSREQTSLLTRIVAIKTTVVMSEVRQITISNTLDTKYSFGGVLSCFALPS